MARDRFLKVMLVVIALLLLANLVKENVVIRPVFAAPTAESGVIPPALLAGGGATTWILIGNQLFYAKVDNYNRIEIFGPERVKY